MRDAYRFTRLCGLADCLDDSQVLKTVDSAYQRHRFALDDVAEVSELTHQRVNIVDGMRRFDERLMPGTVLLRRVLEKTHGRDRKAAKGSGDQQAVISFGMGQCIAGIFSGCV